ncbi:hypothetical protein ACPA9J_35060 [Pseudomonas aeruginosa]
MDTGAEATGAGCGDDLQALDINQAFSEATRAAGEELLSESTSPRVVAGRRRRAPGQAAGAERQRAAAIQLRHQHKDRNGLVTAWSRRGPVSPQRAGTAC